MAWGSSSGTVASQNAKTASASYTAGAITCPSGDIIFLGFVFDNTGSAGTSPVISTLTVPGGETAAWEKCAAIDSPSLGAGNGCREELWVIKTTQTWTAFTPVAGFSASMTAKASGGFCKSGGSRNVRAEAPPRSGSTSISGVPSNANANVKNTDLVVGLAGWQTATVPTADADSTNGSWDAGTTFATSGGVDNTNVAGIIQFKIVNADGTQTYNPTTGVSIASGSVAVPFPLVTDEQVSRVHAEAMVAPTPDEQVSRVHAEAMLLPTPTEQVSRIHLEVMISNTPNPYWSWIA